MSSASIRAKVDRGMGKAVNATGSTSSEKVYLLSESGGNNDPLNPVAPTTIEIELVNAMFKSYNINLIGANIQSGDRELISNSKVVIPTGATIKQGTTNYVVIGPSPTAPTSDVLLYKSQMRVK